MTRYALLGAGMMGQEHIRHIAMLEGAQVAALADPDPAMRTAAAHLAGPDCRVFDTSRALLQNVSADALVIAAPNHIHSTLLDAVATSDLPVLVEKPVCITVEDGARLTAMAARRTAPIWVAMEYRYMPPIARLIEAVRDGGIGTLRMLTIREHRYPFLDKVGRWNRFNRLTGGTLVEKCCHFFDLMRLIAGAEPVRLYASGGRDVNHLDERPDGETPDILDNAYVVVDFANGVRACLELCMFADGSYHQEHLTAVGDTGKVEALVPGPQRFWPSRKARPAELILSPRAAKAPIRLEIPIDPELAEAGDHFGSTYYQHLRFRRMVETGGEPDVSVADGVRAVEIGLAAEHSARTGQVVRLEPE